VFTGTALLTAALILLFMYLVSRRDLALVHAVEHAEIGVDYVKVMFTIAVECS
jgi:hypothetical protein